MLHLLRKGGLFCLFVCFSLTRKILRAVGGRQKRYRTREDVGMLSTGMAQRVRATNCMWCGKRLIKDTCVLCMECRKWCTREKGHNVLLGYCDSEILICTCVSGKRKRHKKKARWRDWVSILRGPKIHTGIAFAVLPDSQMYRCWPFPWHHWSQTLSELSGHFWKFSF